MHAGVMRNLIGRHGNFFVCVRKLSVVAGALALAVLCAPLLARAATPYEAQIGGFMYAALQALIIGEFAGRSPSQADAPLDRPICKPSDYDDLHAAANDMAAFDAFRRRCHLVETTIDSQYVYSTAYLPAGYCETLKQAFDRMLAEQVYTPRSDAGDWVIFEYKGSRYAATRRALAYGARLQTTCQGDGSLRVSALRQRRQ